MLQTQSSHPGAGPFDARSLETAGGTRAWCLIQKYQLVILPWTQEGGLQYLWSIFAGLDSKASIIYTTDSHLYSKSDRIKC